MVSDDTGIQYRAVLGRVNQQFTYKEVLMMTNNFQAIIGKGGFGTVYLGQLGNTQVAVKLLKTSSSQGYKEFRAEVQVCLSYFHIYDTNKRT